MKSVIELDMTGATTPITSYDSTKFNLGTLIKQRSLSAAPEDKFIGPSIVGLARPMEASTAIPIKFPHVIDYSSTIQWVFGVDNAAAAATRRVVWYEFNKDTSIYTWKGFVTLTYPSATNHTVVGFRMIYQKYTTGTVSVSGTAVTGSGSTWTTDRQCIGSRIGFGSTDPANISTWYEISAVGGNTSITLTASAGTIAGGTAYVIEDLQCLTTTTNATATNGGLFVAKGLRIENFSTGGTTIPAATTVDLIRAVYWLADAAVVTNTTAAGCAINDFSTWTDQRAYVLNTTTIVGVYTYNFRAALTLASGKDSTSLNNVTGTQAVTGTMAVANNGRIATLSHGPGSGVSCLYFATTTRIYRAAVSNLTVGNVTWQSDVMLEVPPGGVNTFAASGALSSVEYSSAIDRLIVMTTGATAFRSYVTKYNTTSDPFDHIWLSDDKQLDQSSADSGLSPYPNTQSGIFTVWSEAGFCHMIRHTLLTAVGNHIYSLPVSAHWTYPNNFSVMITPAISTSQASKLYKAYVQHLNKAGSENLGAQINAYKVQYRTSGISDNSGAWTNIGDALVLTGVTPGSQIQFRFLFEILSPLCIPARIIGLALTYEDFNTDSHYEPSVAKSSIASRIFAYRQVSTFGGTIPNLRIRLTNAVSLAGIIDDTVSGSAFGTWQYSTDGTNWNAWSSSADAIGNYIRYTAGSLPASVKVRSLLTQ